MVALSLTGTRQHLHKRVVGKFLAREEMAEGNDSRRLALFDIQAFHLAAQFLVAAALAALLQLPQSPSYGRAVEGLHATCMTLKHFFYPMFSRLLSACH